jgi:Phosphatidylinositol-specific phospholipase C, X domain
MKDNMEAVLILLLLAAIVYMVMGEIKEPPKVSYKRLCDYYVPGSVYENPSDALARGVRLMELHVYGNEQDEPVVIFHPERRDDTNAVSFESVCVKILNQAFPSKEPFILSIVPHTESSYVLNRVAESLKTTVHKHLLTPDGNSIALMSLDRLSNKLILVSGPEVRGTNLEPLINLSWGGSELRRLNYLQAIHSREPEELAEFTENNLVLVAPDAGFKRSDAHDDIYASGCQWNLFAAPGGQVGFIPRV